MQHPDEIELIFYQTASGKEPFDKWFRKLGGRQQAIVLERLDRITAGNEGDYKMLKGGIIEYRIYGAGLRIYAGRLSGASRLVLLGGGKGGGKGKGAQQKDIVKAIDYWNDYLDNN